MVLFIEWRVCNVRFRRKEVVEFRLHLCAAQGRLLCALTPRVTAEFIMLSICFSLESEFKSRSLPKDPKQSSMSEI